MTRRFIAGLAAAATVAATLVSPTSAHVGERTALTVVDDPQVLAISLDGLNTDALRSLGHSDAPHLWRLLDEGAGTLNARTQVELTVTLPNHTSMITGRRIDAGRGGHGVTWNDDRPTPSTVQAAAGHPVESVFSQLQAAGESGALFASKTKFRLWDRSWPAGVDLLDLRDDHDRQVAAAARADLVAHDRAFTFLHLGGADKAGHRTEFMSAAYLDAVRELDRLVGTILRDVDREPELADLRIVLTSDHGGLEGSRTHGDTGRLANFRVPFVVWGPGIDAADLYAINPRYRDPGTRQPSLSGAQPVRNGNVANLALDLLGLPRVPDSRFGLDVRLRTTG